VSFEKCRGTDLGNIRLLYKFTITIFQKLAVDHLRFFRTTVIKGQLKKSRTFDQIQLHLEKKDVRAPLTEFLNTRSFSDHNDLNENGNRLET